MKDTTVCARFAPKEYAIHKDSKEGKKRLEAINQIKNNQPNMQVMGGMGG